MSQETAAIKVAETTYPVHDLIKARWSPRAFDTRPVEPEKLQSILEAARWAASSMNLQPWAFIIARQNEEADAHARMVGCLMEGNIPWASKAPVLGITIANIYRKPEVRNRHAYHDVGLATQNLTIQATALGLYLHLMGGFSSDKAREAFAIPTDFEPVTMFALGYLGDPSGLPERHQEGEKTARTRRSLHDFIYSNRWGESAPLLASGE